jgi:hypothetical protein
MTLTRKEMLEVKRKRLLHWDLLNEYQLHTQNLFQFYTETLLLTVVCHWAVSVEIIGR